MKIEERIANPDFGLDGNDLGRDRAKDDAFRAQLSRLLALAEAVDREIDGLVFTPTVSQCLAALREHGDI